MHRHMAMALRNLNIMSPARQQLSNKLSPTLPLTMAYFDVYLPHYFALTPAKNKTHI